MEIVANKKSPTLRSLATESVRQSDCIVKSLTT
nr:MAG TPA: hypothetical protein [Caudoviricetes sp.]